MSRLFFIILFISSVLCVNAQDDGKYMAGAVPEVNGKVQFVRVINTGGKYTEAKLFEAVNNWAEENYNNGDNDSKVLLSNPETKSIACAGQKKLVFRRNTFVLDQAVLSYQLILEIENADCKASMRALKYEYSDFKDPEPAEKLITDKIAIGKNNKLNRYYDKFRTYTIDSVNSVFDSLEKYLNGVAPVAQVQQQAIAQPVVSGTPQTVAPPQSGTIAPVAIADAPMAGYKRVSADKIPASMSGKEVLLALGTKENPNVIWAKWSGTSTLMDKMQAITNMGSGQKLNNNETYTISFFTEMYESELSRFKDTGGDITDKISAAGLTTIASPSGTPAISEAWMIIECRMSGEIPSAEANSKTCLGEILNVWIK